MIVDTSSLHFSMRAFENDYWIESDQFARYSLHKLNSTSLSGYRW